MNKYPYRELLVCPFCGSKVNLGRKITCKNLACKKEFKIIDGLPVMIAEPINKVEKEIASAKNRKKGFFDKSLFGIPLFKISFLLNKYLYLFFKIKLPKLKNQKKYWLRRGNEYRKEFFEKGYQALEIFFQDLLIRELKNLEFKSIFEAGCGFGWNLRRLEKEFPKNKIGGLDFSHTQLLNAKNFIKSNSTILAEGDVCQMPFKKNAYDIGFSLGVFMNINEGKIGQAINEMIRVSRRYIIHLEYDEKYTSQELKKRRAFKRNIISHDYEKLYKQKGLQIYKKLTFKNFKNDYKKFMKGKSDSVKRWEKWEGPEKYHLLIIKK